MPKTITRTGFENAALSKAFDLGILISRSQQKRIGRECARRLERMSDEDRARLLNHSDPVPCEAFHHLLGSTICRQCGMDPKEAA